MWLHLRFTRSAQSFFQSVGVVSHVTLPSQQVESDAAPALTAVGEAGKGTIGNGKRSSAVCV